MRNHTCRPASTCSCSIVATEPDEQCSIHGVGQWPPQCVTCGRLVKWPPLASPGGGFDGHCATWPWGQPE